MGNENGFGALSVLAAIVISAFLGMAAFELGMGYLDGKTLKKDVAETLIEAKQKNLTKAQTSELLLKKTNQDSLNVDSSDVDVEESDGGYEISVDFSRKMHVAKGIVIVMDLSTDQSN